METVVGEGPAPDKRQEIPWLMLGWFALLLCACYGEVLYDMAREWWTDEDMGHGFFVPVLAGYIVWQKRDRLMSLRSERNSWGLVLVLWGALQLVAGTLGAELFVARTAFLIALVGVILFLGGTEYLKELAFPLFLLIFMIRIPAIIYRQITFPLQLFASEVAEKALSVAGIPVLREGNVLELASQRLSVVEACSGIRSLLSLSFLSVIYAYFFDSKVWMRGVLLVLTIPIAVAANAFRVTMTGVVSEYKREFAQGIFHSMEGWVVFLIALVILVATHRLIDTSFARLKRAS
jgi:exosortase